MRLLDPRNGPAWDLPAWDGPRRVYVIASTPRTGSTLFANALWDTGRVGAPKEYLNPMQRRDFAVRFGGLGERLTSGALAGPAVALAGLASDARTRAHLDRVLAVRTGPGGWFGLKLHAHHFARGWHAVEDRLGAVTWLRVTREDRLGQAISWEKALQTGRWASAQRAWAPPVYVRARLDQRLAAIARDESTWDAFFAARGVRPHVVTYEALTADLTGAVRGALRALGVDDAGVQARPSQQRQADATSAAWRARYLAG